MPKQPGDPVSLPADSQYRRVKVTMFLPLWMRDELDTMPLPRGRVVEQALIKQEGMIAPEEDRS